MAYADNIFPNHFPDYQDKINDILSVNNSRIDKRGRIRQVIDRSTAIAQYLNQTIAEGKMESLQDQVLIDLFDAATLDKHYYDKITASVGPVLSEINKSNASNIFSFQQIEVSDIMALPKGQAFILVNGGELYKVRIPLPLNDGFAPVDIRSVIYQINHRANVDEKYGKQQREKRIK